MKKSVQILKSLREIVLRAPGMYLCPQWDVEGLHHLVLEIIKLAVKPDAQNECSVMAVGVEETGELLIIDNGRGLPPTPVRVYPNAEQPRPKIEHVITHIWERHPNKEYHQEFGFLDYLGAVTNVLSIRLQIESSFEGEHYDLVGSRGEIIGPLKKLGPSNENGTRITFHPDPEVFGDLTFENSRLIAGIQELANEYPQVTFTYEDKRSDLKIRFPLK